MWLPSRTAASVGPTRQRRQQVAVGLIVGFLLAAIGLNSASRYLPEFIPSLGFSRSLELRGENAIISNATAGVLDWITLGGFGTVNEKPTDDGGSHGDDLPPSESHAIIPPTMIVYTREQLRYMYTEFVEREVHFNNWNLGCNDLQFVAPYLKAIMDRLSWNSIVGKDRLSQGQRRQIIVDVGANSGDDAQSILGTFQPVRGMCWRWGTPLLLLSIEPSPKVFCEMTEAIRKQPPPHKDLQRVHLLNVALSKQTGNLVFQDPGNEGGRIVDSNFTEFGLMTRQEWSNVTKCRLSADSYKNQSVDYKRQSVVPTYTLDLLMDSLEALGKLGPVNTNETTKGKGIFALKIDTEGHDYNVLLGSKNLLEQKRIEFVIFEVSRNDFLWGSVKYMTSVGYECYLLGPQWLIPLHLEHHWYKHMNNFTIYWWGNALCGISGSKTMAMLWRSYHSDDLKLASSYEVLYDT
ncbi:expressed unknown protein [Seminavis robusta]|uniref:Methyltransferase FkbM domain-containing protein n=1 Tax=Seminavis robusta TaxID=568900 RepID=A0A9N8DNL9_9STRA|nr:expressed unknown protein [Seminavis robusta]|eukprot:Sro179_g078500.1 n/a (463) ;mRNA; f:49955-51343